jgi:hypothetical protein
MMHDTPETRYHADTPRMSLATGHARHASGTERRRTHITRGDPTAPCLAWVPDEEWLGQLPVAIRATLARQLRWNLPQQCDLRAPPPTVRTQQHSTRYQMSRLRRVSRRQQSCEMGDPSRHLRYRHQQHNIQMDDHHDLADQAELQADQEDQADLLEVQEEDLRHKE